MSEQRLRNLYLPPFKAAIDAGADTVMCSFNAINGVPGCADPRPRRHPQARVGLRRLRRERLHRRRRAARVPAEEPDEGPCGHGVAADGPDAAQAALNAGTDSEMVSTNIRDFGTQLLAQHRISMARIDDAVRRILRVKFRAGLFEHPYVDQAKAVDPASFVTADDRAAARTAAGKSMVLLKNDGRPLPRDPSRRRGDRAARNDSTTCSGPWWGQGRNEDAVRFRRDQGDEPGPTFAQAAALATDPPDDHASDAATRLRGAVAARRRADQVVLALGETAR
jgi:beta-glucosidase